MEGWRQRLGFWWIVAGSRGGIEGHRGVPSAPLPFPRNFNRSVLAVKGSLRRETRAPLTAPGRSELLSAIKERGALGKAKSKSHLTDTVILMEGDLVNLRHLFAGENADSERNRDVTPTIQLTSH